VAAGDLALNLLITAQNQAGSVISGLASQLGPVGLGLVAISAAAIGVGTVATKMAGDFQAGMTRLVTSAGETQSSLAMVSAGILQLSVDTGTSTDQLVAAMYHIESSNYHAAAGLQVLTAASQGAKTENADLTTVSQALLGVLTNYHMPATQATSAMNGLVAVVKNGNTTLQDLSGSMAQVLPTAASLGISFAQVGGAIDTMTSKTMPAQQAAQNLAHVLVALSAPSGVAQKSMVGVGLSAQQVKDALAHQGLPEALQMIETAVGKKFPEGSVLYTTALKNIMGGLVGYKLAAQLTGASLKDTQDHIDAISAAMKNGSGAVDGFAQIQGTFNFKMDQAHQALNIFMITLGTQLLPVIGNIVSAITPAISAFTTWLTKSNAIQNATNTLGAAWQKVSNFLSAVPWGAIIQGIMQFNSMIVQAREKVDWFGPAIQMAFAALSKVDWAGVFKELQKVLQQVGSFLVATFMPVWKQLQDSWKQLQAAIQPIMPQLIQVAQVLGGVLVGVIIFVIATGAGMIKMFAGLLTGLIQFVTGFVQIISGTIQTISGIISFFADLFTGHFEKLGGDLGRIWGGIVMTFHGAWNVIAGLFNAFYGMITGFTSGFSQAIIGIFKDLSDALVGHSIIPDMIHSIIGWFTGLASQAVTLGANIVHGIISGISGMFGNVGQTMNNLVGFIGSFLPHSPAQRGELSHLNEYGPNLVKGIASGITRSIPLLQTSMELLTKPMGATMGNLAYGGGQRAGNATLGSEASSGTSSGPVTIIVMLDGRQIGMATAPHIVSEMRVRTGIRQ
jgi:TP901 family phage tail tape measure protein